MADRAALVPWAHLLLTELRGVATDSKEHYVVDELTRLLRDMLPISTESLDASRTGKAAQREQEGYGEDPEARAKLDVMRSVMGESNPELRRAMKRNSVDLIDARSRRGSAISSGAALAQLRAMGSPPESGNSASNPTTISSFTSPSSGVSERSNRDGDCGSERSKRSENEHVNEGHTVQAKSALLQNKLPPIIQPPALSNSNNSTASSVNTRDDAIESALTAAAAKMAPFAERDNQILGAAFKALTPGRSRVQSAAGSKESSQHGGTDSKDDSKEAAAPAATGAAGVAASTLSAGAESSGNSTPGGGEPLARKADETMGARSASQRPGLLALCVAGLFQGGHNVIRRGKQLLRDALLGPSQAPHKAALSLLRHTVPPSQGVFLPGSRFVRVWEYGILCAILFVVVTAPLRLGFELWGDSWFPFDVVVDAMFALDILISMNTAYPDPENDSIVGQRAVIVKHYLSGGAFAIDFISAFPVWLVTSSKNAKILLLLKPLRLTRVSFITSRSSRLGSSTRLRQATNLAVFGMLIHYLTCAYWWIAEDDPDAGSEWEPRGDWSSLPGKYADALHWTLKSTLKSGPQPETYGQYVFTCAVILIGEVLKAYLIGSITEILTTLRLAEAEKTAQLDNVTTFLSRRKVDADLHKRILEFFDYRWSVGYSVKEHQQLLGQLPAQLSLELSLELKRTLIDKVPMFQRLSSETVVQLAEALKPMLAVPDELIVVQGVVGTGMYYVNRGIVRIEFTPEGPDDRSPAPSIEIMTTSIGSSFGEDSLVTRKARIATVRALTFCDLQRLSYRNYKRIVGSSKEFRTAVERAARDKAAIIEALSRSSRMLMKMGSSAGRLSSPQRQTAKRGGRFTRIAAEAIATTHAFRSPDNSMMMDAQSGGRFAPPSQPKKQPRSRLAGKSIREEESES